MVLKMSERIQKHTKQDQSILHCRSTPWTTTSVDAVQFSGIWTDDFYQEWSVDFSTRLTHDRARHHHLLKLCKVKVHCVELKAAGRLVP